MSGKYFTVLTSFLIFSANLSGAISLIIFVICSRLLINSQSTVSLISSCNIPVSNGSLALWIDASTISNCPIMLSVFIHSSGNVARCVLRLFKFLHPLRNWLMPTQRQIAPFDTPAPLADVALGYTYLFFNSADVQEFVVVL